MSTLWKYLKLRLRSRKTNDEWLLMALYRIKLRPVGKRAGICYSVDQVLRHQETDRYSKMEQLFVSWPKFSGRMVYPVPSPWGNCPQYEFFESGALKWSGEYGRLRKELLDYMITSLEAENAASHS